MGITSELGQALIPIRATLDKLDGDMAEARGKVEGALGKIDESVQKLGKFALTGLVAGVAALATAFVALGAFAFNAGEVVDKAYDTIQVQTGATGARLAELQGTFRTVFANVPTSAQAVTDVIAALGARTDLTGKSLTGLATNLAELAQLTGGDAKTQTELFTRLMGDWSVANEDAARTLDKVFVASQLSGTGVDQLMQQVVQFGAPLRLMGFSLDESIALFGKWEKEGVNAELVMGSLRIAAGKFADAGKPLKESLMATFDAIKNNKDESKALALAMDVFGARAGPDMAAAIREGRFEIEDFGYALFTSRGAIDEATWATADWGEKLTLLKNRATLALEPIGTALMDAAGKVLDLALPAFDAFLATLEPLSGIISAIVEAVTTFVTAILGGSEPLAAFDTMILNIATTLGLSQTEAGNLVTQINGIILSVQGAIAAVTEFLTPIITAISSFVSWQDVLMAVGVVIAAVVIPAIAGVIASMLPLILTAAAIIGAIALLRNAWESDWGGIRTAITTWWTETGSPIFEQLKAWLGVALPAAIKFVSDYFTTVWLPAVMKLWDAFQVNILPLLAELFTWFQTNLPVAIQFLSNFWTNILLPAINQVWTFFTTYIIPLFIDLAVWLMETIPVAIGVLANFWTNTLQPAILAVWSWISTVLMPLLSTLWTWLGTTLTAAITTLSDFWTNTLYPAILAVYNWINDNLVPLFKALAELFNVALTLALTALAGLWEKVLQPALEAVWKFIQDKLMPIFEDVRKFIVDTLGPIIQGLVDGAIGALKGAFEGISKAIQDVIGWIDSVIKKLKEIKLPDFLTPGSPTPFEVGLRGIAQAMKSVNAQLDQSALFNPPSLTFEPVAASAPTLSGLELAEAGSQVNYSSTTTVNTNRDPMSVLRASRHLDKLGEIR